jgi:hypothetical protein
MNIENLKKLRDFWLDAPDHLLAMRDYAYDPNEASLATSEHPCGSCMCLIGSGPSAGIPIGKRQGWASYSVESFGFEYDTREYQFLFDPSWPDNRGQAIARLNLAINNEIPKVWTCEDRY